MRKGQEDKNQSEILRKKGNFNRAATLLMYFGKASITTGLLVSVSGVGGKGVYFERKARKILLLSKLFHITH